MNRITIILLLSVFVIIFFIGLFVGVYKYFPYSELNNIKNQSELKTFEIDDNSLENLNFNDLITIQNITELKEKRNQLIEFIWKTNSLPKQLPNIIDNDISDERFNAVSNLKPKADGSLRPKQQNLKNIQETEESIFDPTF